MSNKKFIEEIAKYVIKYAPNYNIKVHSPIIAQAILESASGTSELAVNANNFFGLKYRAGRCPTASGIYYKIGSEQNADGSYTSSAMQWCKFDTVEKGVIGYFDFISASRYDSVRGVEDPETYLVNIKKAGYATSINYVYNLMAVIKKYKLTQYDKTEDNSNIVINKPIKEGQKYYRCQCGCFSVKANAERRINELKAHGYKAIIKESNRKYYIQVGAYSVKANAENKAKELKEKGFPVYIKYC